MEFAKVNVDVRSAAKKGAARRVRGAGQVPGVLYGRKREPIAVTFNEKELLSSLDKEKRRNTVLKLTVRPSDGKGQAEEVTAMVRDARHRLAADVHELLRLAEEDAFPADGGLRQQRPELLARRRGTAPPRQLVRHHEPEVVAVVRVLPAGIAEADDEMQAGTASP